MNWQLTIAIVLFLISSVLAFSVHVIFAHIINAVNKKRGPMPQIDLLSKDSSFFSIINEYKQLYPDGRLHLLLFSFGCVSLVLFLISARLLGFFSWL